MLPAVSISQIEKRAQEKIGINKGILLIFFSFNGEVSGPSFEFLQRIMDYHYHSSMITDCHCVGYTWSNPHNSSLGPPIEISDELTSHFNVFHPRIFHEIRSQIQKALAGKWRYQGGIDALLFPTGDEQNPVTWDTAAVVSSRKLVGNVFQNSDELLRTVINLDEELHGALEPHRLDVEINRRLFSRNMKKVTEKFGGSLVSAAITQM